MKETIAIGMMSGTSLDGMDLVYVKFTENLTYKFEIITGETIPYSTLWKNKLKNAYNSSAVEITALHAEYGTFIGQKISDFIQKNKIEKLDFIASHGQTIFHNPAQHYTLQIGSGAHIVAICQKTVVCDFRTQDVALGGQGAPLVPIGDELLFSEYDYCLNIGGFANISYQKNNNRLAYDVVPANIVLNHYSEQLGYPYDEGGKLSATGKVNLNLLLQLNNLSFYRNQNAMGFEQVEKEIFPLIDAMNLSINDILRTYTEHIAQKIANEVNLKKSLFITGGGAYNTFLINKIQELSNAKVHIPESQIIEFKEALIFAFLGLLRLENKVNCLQSVTKANKNHSSGVVYHP